MWKKKKDDPKIKVHELEIEKLKLTSQLKTQKNVSIVCACLMLLFFLLFTLILID